MGPVVWAVLGLLLILSEFVVPGFVIFFFGAGALMNALLLVLLPSLVARIPLQILLWAGTSILSLAVLRRSLSRVFRGTLLDNSDDREFVGKSAKVSQRITPDAPGRVRFGGTTWTAISYDETLELGERVDIIQKDGTKFIVTRSVLEE